MNNTRHLLWMGIGFVVLLILAKFVGVGIILLFPLLCFFMMAAMMLGMNHGDHNNGSKGQGGGHDH